MMEPLMRDGKRVLVLAIAWSIALSTACFWREDQEPVEWVELPEAIVIQMRRVGGLPGDDPLELDMPDFTLYGDGTVIYRATDPAGDSWAIATLPNDSIAELLEFIRGKGFMEFTYDQPEPGSVSDAQTTLLYVNAKSEANAVSAYALDSDAEDGDAWDQFRALQEIVERLDEVDPVALGGSVEGEFAPEQTRIIAQLTNSPEAPAAAIDWPYPKIALPALVHADGSAVEFLVDGDVGRMPVPRFETYVINGTFYRVGFQPVLPHEENFPEFDVAG
jgi:hypothetical protein